MSVPWPSEAVEGNRKERRTLQSAQITFTDDQLACDPQNRMQDHTYRDIIHIGIYTDFIHTISVGIYTGFIHIHIGTCTGVVIRYSSSATYTQVVYATRFRFDSVKFLACY